MNQANQIRRIAMFAVLAGAVLAAALPAQADPPPWAPAHGQRAKQQREYQYVYYPARQVYYAPAERTWFWMNGGAWQFGVSLPSQFQGTISSGVPVVLHSDRPYVEHVVVEERVGRPWREKHKGKGKNKEKNKDKHHDHEDHDDHHEHGQDDRHGHRD
jgi:hypothetical protein